MAKRPHIFNAGPAVLPVEVIQEVSRELLDTNGTGFSILEWSHRDAPYEKVRQDVHDRFFQLLGIPRGGEYEFLLLQGGASLQFAMVPMNFASEAKKGDYVTTGQWSEKALADAKLENAGREIWTGKADNYARIPKASEYQVDPNAAYLHITSNNTIFGTQFHDWPKAGAVPVVVDASSDIFCRPIDLKGVGMIYAGAQKNLGPAGITAVLVRKDLLERAPAKKLAKMLDYRAQVQAEGIYNTPPTFAVWLMGKTLAWIQNKGGLAAVGAMNQKKADLLYAEIDRSGFYRGHAAKDSRSIMNVNFRLGSEDLEKQFVKAAEAQGFVGLKGHRSVGGCRASIYNACPLASVEALVAFMREFERTHG